MVCTVCGCICVGVLVRMCGVSVPMCVRGCVCLVCICVVCVRGGGGGVVCGVCVCVCVCVRVCNHRQPRTYSKTPHSARGQHCKRGRSTICGYVQTVANCLLLHSMSGKKEKITCTRFGPRFSGEK